MASEQDPSANERQAAQAALRALDPQWPGDAAAQSSSSRTVEQMQSTLAALRGWQETLAELPPLEVPLHRTNVIPWRRWTIPFAAAAVLLLGVGVWWGLLPQAQMARVEPPNEPPPAGVAAAPPPADHSDAGPPPEAEIGAPATGAADTSLDLVDSSQWLSEAPPPEVIGKGSVVGSEGGIGSPPGGDAKKPPRGTVGTSKDGGFGGGGKGGVSGPGEEFLAEARLEFPLRVPASLTGGWTFLRGKRLSSTRAQLTYTQDDRVLSVLVWKDPGENAGPDEKVFEKGRRLLVVRRDSVGVAFEGGILRKDAGVAARLFAPAKP